MKMVWDHERGGYRKQMTLREKAFIGLTALSVTGLIWNFYANDAIDNTPVASIEVADPVDDLVSEKIDEVTRRLFPAPAQPKEIILVVPTPSPDLARTASDVRSDQREVQDSEAGDPVRVERPGPRPNDLQPCPDLSNPTAAHPTRTGAHKSPRKHNAAVVAKVHRGSAVQAHGRNPGSRGGVRCLDQHTWGGSLPTSLHTQPSRGPPIV